MINPLTCPLPRVANPFGASQNVGERDSRVDAELHLSLSPLEGERLGEGDLTVVPAIKRHSRAGGNPKHPFVWAPAFAGVTDKGSERGHA